MELLAKGRTLVCEIADFDACDQYIFQIDDAGAGLTAKWKLVGCGDNGTVALADKAVEAGTNLIAFGQGNVARWKGDVASDATACKDNCDCHTLPFLLSRGALSALKNGKPVELNVFGELQTFTKAGTQTRELEVDGKKTPFATIQASSKDGDLWVIDDPRWPVLVRVETAGGDNYSELSIVSTESIEALESKLDDKD